MHSYEFWGTRPMVRVADHHGLKSCSVGFPKYCLEASQLPVGVATLLGPEHHSL